MNKSYENDTILSIADYVRQGEKHDGSHLLGIEVEHIIFDNAERSIEYCSFDGKPGVCDIMAELAPLYKSAEYSSDNNAGKFIKKLVRSDIEVTFEPGGQLEAAMSPVSSVAEEDAIYSKFLSELENACTKFDCHVEYVGVRPDKCALEVQAMSTNRYAAMDARFRCIGTCGPIMMRNSAALQVSVDFSDEQDCAKKLRVATCIAPLIYFLFDNSPVFERAKVGAEASSVSEKDVPPRMARYHIWRNTDSDRTGAIHSAFGDFSYEKYACQAADIPIIYTHGNHANLADEELADKLNYDYFYGPHTTREISHNKKLDPEEIEHVLSMGFYDARVKQFIELRACDCVPPKYAFAYIALVQGIFNNEDALNSTFEIFKNANEQDYINAGQALYRRG